MSAWCRESLEPFQLKTDQFSQLLIPALSSPPGLPPEAPNKSRRFTAGSHELLDAFAVHRVKGLEWPRVIVLSATEGLMPHRLASYIEEERRVFHVAIARGSESVAIIADGPRSPFIAEMSWRYKLEPAGLGEVGP